ncbi:RNA recognition motif containing protein [Artemisia annua]|uniref:RNA recognition motif containing protein n=1 Tax=Artemisia annua TaxID=35608 RepID=A0A2U1ND21_ARTAN|nr:RNA recognition motif containing protein [Artemisia annua]
MEGSVDGHTCTNVIHGDVNHMKQAGNMEHASTSHGAAPKVGETQIKCTSFANILNATCTLPKVNFRSLVNEKRVESHDTMLLRAAMEKVLLMTLQNAPPGLPYERDKNFSKVASIMTTWNQLQPQFGDSKWDEEAVWDLSKAESTIALAMLLQKYNVELEGFLDSVELVTVAIIHTKNMIDVYTKIVYEETAMPVISGRKSLVVKIETKKMLIQMVEAELEIRKKHSKYKKEFKGHPHFFVWTKTGGVYNLFYPIIKRSEYYSTMTDSSTNNLVHLAGRLAPSFVLSRATGAALQLQRELQWRELSRVWMSRLDLLLSSARTCATRDSKFLLTNSPGSRLGMSPSSASALVPGLGSWGRSGAGGGPDGWFSGTVCAGVMNASKVGPESLLNTLASHQENPYAYSAGEVVTMAQDVVKTMLARGYILGKDALGKAKAFDESHQVSASAAAKVAELSERYGITDKLCAGIEVVRSVEKNYHISNTTKSIVSATGRSAIVVATTMVNSNYFSKGSLWMSDALSGVAKAEECS